MLIHRTRLPTIAAVCAAATPLVAQRDSTAIEWESSLASALRAAAKDSRKIAIYFWIGDSDYCRRMWEETLGRDRAVAELSQFVCLSTRADQEHAAALMQRFAVTKLPTMLFAASDGQAEDAIRGFIDLDAFVAECRRIRTGDKTVSDWRRRCHAAPDDLDARLQLALQLRHVGERDESAHLIASIKRADPKGASVAGAQLRLYDVFDEVRASAADASDPSTYDLTPLYAHLPVVRPRAVLHEAWRWIADVEHQRGDRPHERTALAETWRHATEGKPRADASATLLQRYTDMGDELNEAERALALEVAHWLRDAARAHPEAPANYVHHAHAMALFLNHRLDQAIDQLQNAIELAPDEADHRQLLERVRQAQRARR